MNAELLYDARAELGEGPVWDERTQRLYWVDITGMAIHFAEPVSGKGETVAMPGCVGAVALTESGRRLLCVLQDGFYFVHPDTKEVDRIGEPVLHTGQMRFNDAKCDPAGRLIAGTLSLFDGKLSLSKGEGEASLYRLDPDGRVDLLLEGITLSNGMGWSPDGGTMYHIDTPTMRVDAFDYDVARGVLGNRRSAIRIPDGEGIPDGMTVDAEGMVWVAHWGGARITRWNPETGGQLAAVPIPAVHTTSLCFGGPSYRQLYVTTARIGMKVEQLEQQLYAGGVFRVEPGPPSSRFDDRLLP
ncbi:SMP-30/gluconolactonase/LRE family protein [Paenibacillus thiaminolyticus]|uniref:Regucalcin n=1 Tax=Paenibacillus thiaminolyticus TaxID=49283 RepID=A0A3A3GXT2_PANTH|nr:SMP-30/gluconolactonase/LRE family protein [Paenibacillus thiaminolyticus]RJG22943.1 SMP-30/gluconolactonase/LRE family protein [Paenibacillus thiaminolyticus]